MVITMTKLYKLPILVNKHLLPGILSTNFFLCPPRNSFFSPLLTLFFFVCSSGDSTGVNPVDQKKLYDDAVAKKPSTILSLEHEVYGMFLSPFPFPFLFFFINAAFFFLNISFILFFFQIPARKYLFYFLSFFSLGLIRRNVLTDTMSFHTRSKFSKELDTSWLQLLNVLGKILTSALILLPLEMYVVLSLFISGIFFFDSCVIWQSSWHC